jgi:hypothetical protein
MKYFPVSLVKATGIIKAMVINIYSDGFRHSDGFETHRYSEICCAITNMLLG